MNYLLLLLILYGVLSLLTTVVVVRNEEFDKTQKGFQIALIWLLPLVGGVTMLLVHKSFSETNKRKKTFGGGPSANSDIGAAGD